MAPFVLIWVKLASGWADAIAASHGGVTGDVMNCWKKEVPVAEAAAVSQAGGEPDGKLARTERQTARLAPALGAGAHRRLARGANDRPRILTAELIFHTRGKPNKLRNLATMYGKPPIAQKFGGVARHSARSGRSEKSVAMSAVVTGLAHHLE